ncbi:MAG: hypothetical protein RLZZ324_1197 [Candidatus Parcubacteria bacterium]
MSRKPKALTEITRKTRGIGEQEQDELERAYEREEGDLLDIIPNAATAHPRRVQRIIEASERLRERFGLADHVGRYDE